MNFVFTASRLMKCRDVRMLCKEMKENPTILLALELEAKKRLFAKKQKAAS